MLKELIDKFYSDSQRDKEQCHFYITDAGRCPRSVFFKFKNAPRREMEPRLLRLFDHGNYIHRLIMKALFSANKIYVVASEINIPPQKLISGRADAIISDGKNLYVLDIKSINSMIFSRLLQPKEEHINQIELYLHFLGPKKGILLYINKDTQDIKEFIVDYDKSKCLELLKSLQGLKKNIDAEIVPSSLEDFPSNKECRYCQFKNICKIAGKQEIKWNDFKKQLEQLNNFSLFDKK